MSNTQQLLDNWEGIDSDENAALHDASNAKALWKLEKRRRGVRTAHSRHRLFF
jgi:hypothetical protein